MIDQLVTFPLSPQSYYIVLLKWELFALHRKCFLRIYWDKEKTKIKEGRYGYCKWNEVPRLYYLGPNHSFAHEIVREDLYFYVLLTVTTFPKSIQSNFTLILSLKKMEMSKAAVNYIRQYQQNFS